ncbi:MAG: HD domain-containing phosphohydrolase [Cyanobacteriota bacterium]|nr:HD domain-containing phosphohydrolase [Cyanobacteriota bacterium]
MNKEDKKQSGVSIFGQSEHLMGADPIEEMFALNLGDFLTKDLISEDLAKKISIESSKKERLINQLKELTDLYSSKNTLHVLDFDNKEETAIYTSIAKSIVQMLEVEQCRIFFEKNGKFSLIGNSGKDTTEFNFNPDELIHNETLEKDGYLCIPIRNSITPIGAIELKISHKLEDDFLDVVLSIANLLGTTITLQKVIEQTHQEINDESVSEFELKKLRGDLTVLIGDLCDYQQNFVESLATAVDRKGQYTVSHSRNSAKLARNICAKLGLNEKTTDLIYYAALLQNIGKITLPEKLFATNGKLSPQELNKIKNHTNIGVNLLMNINFLSEVVPYITYQTERVDGSGFPEGLKGQSIPLGSRIIAVSDAYSAMTSDRPYRKAMDKDKALAIMKEESGSKWDPDVINALFQVVKNQI